MRVEGESVSATAESTGRSKSTISRELTRNSVNGYYFPFPSPELTGCDQRHSFLPSRLHRRKQGRIGRQLALIRQNIFVHKLAGRRDGGAPAQTVRSAPAWKRCVLIDHVRLRAGALRNSPSTAVPMRPAKHSHPKNDGLRLELMVYTDRILVDVS